MATDVQRFIISATHNIDMELDKVKREAYCKDMQNEMIRDLIMRESRNLKTEKATKEDRCERMS